MNTRQTRQTKIKWGKSDYTWHSVSAERTMKINVIVKLGGYANKDKLICELVDKKFDEIMERK